ncbi:MAG: hypothetical protein ACKOFA_06890 [Rhodoluna sp.]
MKVSRALAAVLVLMLGLSITQSSNAATPAPTNRYIAFLAQESGGYTTYEWAFQRTPSVVVYSDGLTISEVPYRTKIYPGPMVSAFLQKIERGAVSRVLSGATKVNLSDPNFDWGRTWITDVTDTVVLTQQSPRSPRVSLSIYALAYSDNTIDPDKKAARKAANDFIDRVENFSSDLYWTKSRPVIWKPTRWVYMAQAAQKDDFSVIRPWFGTKPLISGFKCQEMNQFENSRFNSLLPRLNQSSRFTSGGKTWRIVVRPLFPHESGCQDIIR